MKTKFLTLMGFLDPLSTRKIINEEVSNVIRQRLLSKHDVPLNNEDPLYDEEWRLTTSSVIVQKVAFLV